MKLSNYILLLLIVLPTPALSKIEKLADSCENKICFYWWPELPDIKGWHHEREYSFKYKCNAQAPDGYNFSNAESVIYAKALYKPRVPKTKSLKQLIKDDQKSFLSKDKTIKISKVASLITADGKKMPSYTFFPKKKGNWERVSYGEEGDFYLIFTLSSRSKAGFDKAFDTYREYIAKYRE